ncbi:MAG: sugar-binding domain-containing protein [Tepidisphaeraceae bacterium]
MMDETARLRRAGTIALVTVMGLCLAACTASKSSQVRAVSPEAKPLPEITLDSGWQLQDAAKVPDRGDAVSSVNYSPAGWFKATVPGTVLTSLVNDGVYPEPLYGENDRPDKIPGGLCRTSYWYRTQFLIPPEYGGKHVWLNFHGINYIAEVWVNGQDLGSIKGAFVRGIFDIAPYVTAGQTCALAVQITPPPHPGIPHEHTVEAGTGRNGGILSEDGATFLCTLGWDWIPAMRDRDVGIWQKVTLSASGPVVVRDPMVSSDLPLPRTDSADLTLQATVQNLTGQPQAGVLHGTFADVSFDFPLTLGPNESKILTLTPAEIPQLHVNQPQLWWPNGYGQQNLYKLQLGFDVDGTISDAKEVSFGIRKITYEVPGSKNLTLSVNGVPVMCKGGDWGMDEAMKRIPRRRLEAQIRLHQQANFNMIRNWVGQSTSDDFYDLCDQYGIMVWDEFFQPNRSDGPNVVNVDMYLANVRDKILRYRSHPSIAIWCGRNESNPAPESVDRGIQKIAAELDPARLYHRNSANGRGVRSGGPYRWREPREFYTFTEAFKTEIGSVSIPTLEAIHAMMPRKDWETVNDDWAEHDLCRGAQEAARGRSPFYPDIIAQRYGPVANLPDFVRKAQLANYEDFRAMYEGRFAKLFKPCTGVLTWMSNPAQPSLVWQIYSYDLEAHASLFGARKACESVHIQMNQDNFHVMVINQTPRSLDNLVAWVRVYNLDGSLKYERRHFVVAQPSAATDLGAIDWPADLSPVHFVKLELDDRDDAVMSDNFYWRASANHPDDFTALQTLPTASLDARITRRDDEKHCRLDVNLSNASPVVALMAHLQLRRQSSNERVLPVYYSDNYVSLLPGESRSISVEAAIQDLGNDQPLIVLDGWNVTTASRSFSEGNGDSSIAPNTQAQVDSSPTGNWIVMRPTKAQTRPSIPWGLFDDDCDIGAVLYPGKVDYDAFKKIYTVTGNGENMWFGADAFHFLWKKVSGDFALEADVSFPVEGKNPHRKACLLVRQSLDANSAYADAALHGVGLSSLQYRDETGANTHEVQSNVSAPQRLRIEKHGDYVYMLLARQDQPFEFSGAAVRLKFQSPFYVGLGVCSHEKLVSETAIFSNVHLVTDMPTTKPQAALHSTLETIAIASTDRHVTYTSAGHFEAPNWTPDGASLLFNRDGRIWRIPVAGGTPAPIDTGFATRCNNDHGISPDGKMIAISDQSAKPHQSIIYTVPIGGGTPHRVTKGFPSYWHGWSPDGSALAFCGQRDGKFGIFTIPPDGGDETRLTTATSLDDGPDFSPDGKYIYFNSDRTGMMQIWRMRPDGTDPRQITSDDFNNWFAHPSPDGRWIVFLTYDKDVKGHPANKDVTLRLMSLGDGKITVLAKLFGGQGTINVPSWSPDSRRLAFVSYQLLP